MNFVSHFQRKRTAVRFRNRHRLEGEHSSESFSAIFGFSAIGLLLACILSLLPTDGDFASTKLLLILLAAPVAALLGFALGNSD